MAAGTRRLDGAVSFGLALAALLLYSLTLAPTVLEADGGEFQFVPWLPGIAHPTGYPLYILIGWAWTHLLPVGEVAWRMNLLSALFAAIAVAILYGIIRLVLEEILPEPPDLSRVLVAAAAAATFAVSQTFWSQALIAEVYSLHAVFVAAILALGLKCARSGVDLTSPGCKLLSFTVGLGLTHHSTIILLLPALVLFLWYRRRQSAGRPPVAARTLLAHGLLLASPLLLYLYLPLMAPSTPYATLYLSESQPLVLYENSLKGFWQHITGAVFFGELRPAAAGPERLVLTWQLLRQQVGLVGALLAGIGLIVLLQRRSYDLLLLTGLSFLGIVSFNLVYFIGDVFVLFIPAWLIVSLWIGVGSLALVHWLTAGYIRRKGSPDDTIVFKRMGERLSQNIYRLMAVGLGVLFFVLPVILLTTRISTVNQATNVMGQIRWQEILKEPLPTGAVLLSNDRNEMMPMWYYQYVEERRPDLLGLFPLIVPRPEYANIGRLLDQALASKRPVYFVKQMDGLNLKVDPTPTGTLFQALPISFSPTYPLDVTLPALTVQFSTQATETIKLMGYDLQPDSITPGSVITATLYWQTVQKLTKDYTSYVHLVDNGGQGITQSDHRPGAFFYPSSLWQPGETLRDRHTFTLPLDLPPGVYRLRAGMYYQPEPGTVVEMGQGIDLGPLTVTNQNVAQTFSRCDNPYLPDRPDSSIPAYVLCVAGQGMVQ